MCGLALAGYKVQTLGFPLTPGQDLSVWIIEARVAVRVGGGSAKVDFRIPKDPPGFRIIDEDFISGSFGLAVEGKGQNREAQWAVRRASGRQVLYYRVTVHEDTVANGERGGPTPKFPNAPDYGDALAGIVETLLESVRAESADIRSFTRELLIRLNADTDDENIALLRKRPSSATEWLQQIRDILAGAHIPSRVVWGLRLREGSRDRQLEPWLEVHDGDRWLAFDPYSGRYGFPEKYLIWKVGDAPLIATTRATSPTVEFAAASRTSDLFTIANQRARALGSRVMEFFSFCVCRCRCRTCIEYFSRSRWGSRCW